MKYRGKSSLPDELRMSAYDLSNSIIIDERVKQ